MKIYMNELFYTLYYVNEITIVLIYIKSNISLKDLSLIKRKSYYYNQGSVTATCPKSNVHSVNGQTTSIRKNNINTSRNILLPVKWSTFAR